MVIDGGTLDSGERLVNHIKTRTGPAGSHLVVSTHPDGDHSSGLTVVLEELEVERALDAQALGPQRRDQGLVRRRHA